MSHFSTPPTQYVVCVCICSLPNMLWPKNHQQVRQSKFWRVKLFIHVLGKKKKFQQYIRITLVEFDYRTKCDYGKCQSFTAHGKERSEYAAIRMSAPLATLTGETQWKKNKSANPRTDWLCNSKGKIWKYLFKLDHYVLGQFHVLEHPL